MSGQHRREKRRLQTIQIWSYEQAKGVLPYLRSVMQSLREHRLEILRQQREAKRLDALPGRPDRSTIIAREDALVQARLAEQRFREAQEELEILDIYCLDPVGGHAVVPFVHEDKLAWFIYDLFEEEPFRFWRYHGDRADTRRPIVEVLDGQADSGRTMVA